jgi:hypothetical protein
MSFEEILRFIVNNEKLILAAIVVCIEAASIVVNFVRKVLSERNRVQTIGEDFVRETTASKLWWSANPLNLFRSPN